MLFFRKDSNNLDIYDKQSLSFIIIKLYKCEVVNWSDLPSEGCGIVIFKSFKRLSVGYNDSFTGKRREKYLNIKHRIPYNEFKVYIKIMEE